MKAIVHTKYGPPEVASIREVDKPTPKDNEVLVKVYASTVNRTDAGFRSAIYFISRFWSGLFRPKITVLGSEFAGRIEQVGKLVTSFKIGDNVFGYNDKTFGGHGEYLTIGEKEAIDFLPENTDFYEAAPITEGAHYALNNIRASKTTHGQNVMVYGATGAIGSAAVQLLKHLGTNVTAVCNSKNVELVKSLGADVVIDYQTNDYTKVKTKFDFIFDAVGKSSYRQCKPLLNKKGIYISTELGKHAANLFLALITPIAGGKKVKFPIPSINKKDVVYLKELVEQGVYKPLIDRQYTIDQIVEAYHYVESGQKTGNVILRISQ